MALLESKPAPDRAPDSLAAGTLQPLRGELEQLLGADRVLARASDLVRYASDASPYRLLPQVVVMAHDAEDVAKVLAYGKRSGIPVRAPSPQNSSGPRIATMASFPCSERTMSLTFPSLM